VLPLRPTPGDGLAHAMADTLLWILPLLLTLWFFAASRKSPENAPDVLFLHFYVFRAQNESELITSPLQTKENARFAHSANRG